MADQGLTRRELAKYLFGSAAALAITSISIERVRAADPPYGKKKSSTPPPAAANGAFDKIITPGRLHDWTLKVTVTVTAYVEKDSKGMPIVHDFDLATAAVVFPVLKGSSSHKVYTEEVTGKLTLNDVLMTDQIDYNDAYPCGTRLGRWELTNKAGREVELQVQIPMTCWETVYDEGVAEKAAWPSGPWPQVPASTFADFQAIPPKGVLIEHNNPVVRELLMKWTAGKDPKTLPPAKLAKFLSGQVLEFVQLSGQGLTSARNGMLQGMDLQGAVGTIATAANNPTHVATGSEHDMACVLTAIYRAAGLPSRVVIGYDISDKKGDQKNFLSKQTGSAKIRSWVEFCLYDETGQKVMWVPVDVARMREKGSSRAPDLDRAWKYFGTNPDLNDVMPFAFQYHPPAPGTLAHGSVAFWGWFTTPNAQVAHQFLRFDAQTTPKSSNTKRRDG